VAQSEQEDPSSARYQRIDQLVDQLTNGSRVRGCASPEGCDYWSTLVSPDRDLHPWLNRRWCSSEAIGRTGQGLELAEVGFSRLIADGRPRSCILRTARALAEHRLYRIIRILDQQCCNLTSGFRLSLLLADKHLRTIEVSQWIRNTLRVQQIPLSARLKK
jgi:hypothetical protein